MNIYFAYNLVIHSELVLPHLPTISPVEKNDKIDHVNISFGKVHSDGIYNPTNIGLYYQSTKQLFWLHVPSIARFLVIEGHQIIIDPIEENEDGIRAFLLGTCIGILLRQRNVFLLHGGALKIGEHGVAIIGDAGIGKSTLLGAFFKQRHSILADNLCAIDSQCNLIPGASQIALWPHAMNFLGLASPDHHKIRPCLDKLIIPLKEQYYAEKLPISTLYILKVHEKESIHFSEITGSKKIEYLQKHAYGQPVLNGLWNVREYLNKFFLLANNTNIVCIYRSAFLLQSYQLVDLIERDLNKRGLR